MICGLTQAFFASRVALKNEKNFSCGEFDSYSVSNKFILCYFIDYNRHLRHNRWVTASHFKVGSKY